MSLDPMKSAISIGNVDDTSLALPSGHQHRSGQQRVLEQVQTIRRTRSRTSSNRTGSASLSPTSPSFDSVFGDAPKSLSNTSNGGLFIGNGFSQALSQEKNINRQLANSMKGSSMKKNTSSAYQSQSYAALGSMAAAQPNTSRSDSDVLWQRSVTQRSAPPQRFLSNMATYKSERATARYVTGAASQPQVQPQLQPWPQPQLQPWPQPQLQPWPQPQLQPRPQPQPPPLPRPPLHRAYTVNGTGQTTSHSQFVSSHVNVTPKSPVTESAPMTKEDSGSNDHSGVADITMKEAVEYLSNKDESYQHCGASYIQHNSFIDDKAKEEVLKLKGVHPLVGLLRSSSPKVSETASAALRNLSFKSSDTKEEMHRSGGIAQAAALLRDSDSVETQKQLTGLLWNLSSVDSLKPDLLKSAVPVLMERAILPYAAGPDRTGGSSSSSRDPEVFFNATGCLRNLSSTKQSNRQAMRKCRGLVDSLVGYVQNCVDAGTPDEKSVENCVCILHNLTFQLEDEVPVLFSRITTLAKAANRGHSPSDAGPIGCFSPPGKQAEHEQHFDYPAVEDPQPSGAGLLIHSKTMHSYLSLLETSQREETQEACCGALQNLTAHDSIVSSVMSQTIVQKLNGLQVISPLLRSKKVNMKRNIVGLVGNLTKNPNLHNTLARKALPELLAVLSAGTKEGNESDDTLAMACQTSNCLLMKEPEMSKHLLSNNLINSLKDLSQNGYLPKSSKAAALLLFNMWSEKDLQSVLKKQGMSKSSFVNDVTTTAHKSVQVVD